MHSSPGICQFSDLGPTNADVFGYVNGECDAGKLALVKLAVSDRITQLMSGRVVSDPIKVFVKPEPHKLKKIEEGRLRLISSVSLVDTMVDRVLFGWLQRKALTVVGKAPCLCGWTPLNGGWRYIYERFGNKPVACLDKSAWDWTVQPYLVDLWLAFIKDMAVCPAQWWIKAIEVRFEALFDKATFQFRDGTHAMQQGKGLMKSGCFLTLLLNSVGQSLIHYLAMAKLGLDPMLNQPVVIGDDTVQKSFPELLEYVIAIGTLGVKVKGFKVQNWVEFIGFEWENGVCVPAYKQKHLFKTQYEEISKIIEAYQMLYANEPKMFEYMQQLAVSVDSALVVSSSEAKGVMNGM